jgi:hypothetical protein
VGTGGHDNGSTHRRSERPASSSAAPPTHGEARHGMARPAPCGMHAFS